MAKIQAEIDELKAGIKAIKDANPHWASDAGVIAAITAARQQILALEAHLAPGKLPINIHIAFYPRFAIGICVKQIKPVCTCHTILSGLTQSYG
jgi:hypothetical protein